MSVAVTTMRVDEVFKALASVHRREILRILGESTPGSGKNCCAPDEVCACKLTDRLGLAASTVSHHMSVLRKAGLVDGRKDGLWTYYTLRREVLDEAAEELQAPLGRSYRDAGRHWSRARTLSPNSSKLFDVNDAQGGTNGHQGTRIGMRDLARSSRVWRRRP